MHFLINSPTRKPAKRRKVKKTSRHTSQGVSMARRRRRRKAAINSPKRRRRHTRRRINPGGLGPARAARHNPPRRRHRRRHTRINPRRRYRRNPSILGSSRGIVGGIVQGLKDGGAVVLGQVAARKIKGAVTGMLPATAQAQVSSGVGAIALSLVSAIGASLIAKKALPGSARLITAGAFSETINQALAQTPVAPYLAGTTRRPVRLVTNGPGMRRVAGVRAWPGSGVSPTGRTGVAAWPQTVGMPHGM